MILCHHLDASCLPWLVGLLSSTALASHCATASCLSIARSIHLLHHIWFIVIFSMMGRVSGHHHCRGDLRTSGKSLTVQFSSSLIDLCDWHLCVVVAIARCLRHQLNNQLIPPVDRLIELLLQRDIAWDVITRGPTCISNNDG